MRFSGEHGYFEIENLPGCRQVAVTSHAFVFPDFRSRGFGKANAMSKDAMLESLGYDFAICTVKVGNESQERILKSGGWNVLAAFTNHETGNRVNVWGKEITNENRRAERVP